MQDLSSLVGRTSSKQDESVELSIRVRISSRDAGLKFDSNGGCGIKEDSVVSELLLMGGIEEQSLEILSSKKFRKLPARVEGELAFGRDFGIVRPSRESRVPQSFLGQF